LAAEVLRHEYPDEERPPGRRVFLARSLDATMVIPVLSFLVWLHHFFTMGASVDVNGLFGVMIMIIAVPTGVKVFNWLFTKYGGRVQNARRQNRRWSYWGERTYAEDRHWRGAHRNWVH
jgi:hypothetical protein